MKTEQEIKLDNFPFGKSWLFLEKRRYRNINIFFLEKKSESLDFRYRIGWYIQYKSKDYGDYVTMTEFKKELKEEILELLEKQAKDTIDLLISNKYENTNSKN